MYDLFAVLVHSGSANGGHYFAYIKDYRSGKWYEFNDSRVTEIGEEGVTFEAGGRRKTVPADHVFLATGMKPCGGLYEQLCAEGVKAYIVGDCQTPGKIYDAIHSGYKAGLKV